MSKTNYQSYTEATPIEIYRKDFLHRSAMCQALSKRYPALAPIATEAAAHVTLIDAHHQKLQQLEDDQTRADALQDAEKFDAVEVYTEMRRTMGAKNYDVLLILPKNPSILRDQGPQNFSKSMGEAIEAINTLPDGDPIKSTFLTTLQQEFAEFKSADEAEDKTQSLLKAGKVALTLFKAEQAQARNAQLGVIQGVVRDREKTAVFTLPWRAPKKSKDEGEDSGPAQPKDAANPTG